jgi:biopolymer transport protein ExbD
MRIPTRGRQMGLSFDITPLIDIVFQLIIFFLAATYIIRSDASEKVQLPKATQAKDFPPASPRRWVVTITAERAWFLGSQRSDRAAIEQQLVNAARTVEEATEIEVRLRADAGVPFSEVEPLMITCAKLGIRKLGFAVLHESTP